MRAYDIKSVHLYGAAGRRNFPDGYFLPPEPSLNRRVANGRERREEREARERLASEVAGATQSKLRRSAACMRSMPPEGPRSSTCRLLKKATAILDAKRSLQHDCKTC